METDLQKTQIDAWNRSENFFNPKIGVEIERFWISLKSKKILTKVSGITIQTLQSYFQSSFKSESKILDTVEQSLGNHNYCFSNWSCTEHLNATKPLKENAEET